MPRDDRWKPRIGGEDIHPKSYDVLLTSWSRGRSTRVLVLEGGSAPEKAAAAERALATFRRAVTCRVADADRESALIRVALATGASWLDGPSPAFASSSSVEAVFLDGVTSANVAAANELHGARPDVRLVVSTSEKCDVRDAQVEVRTPVSPRHVAAVTPRSPELVAFLRSLADGATMAYIRRAFPGVDVESALAELVDAGLVVRDERRARFSATTVDAADVIDPFVEQRADDALLDLCRERVRLEEGANLLRAADRSRGTPREASLLVAMTEVFLEAGLVVPARDRVERFSREARTPLDRELGRWLADACDRAADVSGPPPTGAPPPFRMFTMLDAKARLEAGAPGECRARLARCAPSGSVVELLLDLGDAEAAERMLGEIAHQEPSLLAEARLRREQGILDIAAELAQRAVNGAATHVVRNRALWLLGEIRHEQGLPREALHAYHLASANRALPPADLALTHVAALESGSAEEPVPPLRAGSPEAAFVLSCERILDGRPAPDLIGTSHCARHRLWSRIIIGLEERHGSVRPPIDDAPLQALAIDPRRRVVRLPGGEFLREQTHMLGVRALLILASASADGNRIATDDLAARVWPSTEGPPALRRNRLYVLIRRLRVLGAPISQTQEGYGIDADVRWVDAQSLDRLS